MVTGERLPDFTADYDVNIKKFLINKPEANLQMQMHPKCQNETYPVKQHMACKEVWRSKITEI